MSRRRKEKNSKKQERKANKQRPRIPSSDLRSTIYYQPVPEQTSTFIQRQQVDCFTGNWRLESNDSVSISPTSQGVPTLRKIKSETDLDTERS